MRWVNFKSLAATTLLAASASVSAALIDAPVPSNAFITLGDLDWAWASPCSPAGCNAGTQLPLDLSYQATQGWRLPTASEFAARPQPADFFFDGANVNYLAGISPEGTVFNGNTPLRMDGACATAYFTSASPFNECNYGDALLGAIYGAPEWANESNVETWLVRDASSVPEPGTLALLGLGLAGLAASRRRKQ